MACVPCRERKSKVNYLTTPIPQAHCGKLTVNLQCDGDPADRERSCSSCHKLNMTCTFDLTDARKWFVVLAERLVRKGSEGH